MGGDTCSRRVWGTRVLAELKICPTGEVQVELGPTLAIDNSAIPCVWLALTLCSASLCIIRDTGRGGGSVPRHRQARYRACLGCTASKSACHCSTWRSEGVQDGRPWHAATAAGWSLARLHGDGLPCLQLTPYIQQPWRKGRGDERIA